MKTSIFSLLVGLLCFSAAAKAQGVSETKYDYSTVARQITAGCHTKWEQARNIYQWLCQNIAYDTDYRIYTADECWENKKGVCQAYCELFYRLGEPLGLKCMIISGKSKDSDGKIGDIGHAWLYVEVDGGCILVDPTWGAGGVKDGVFERSENDMSWFQVDPYWLIYTHYPDDERFQYLDAPISWETFVKLPVLYPIMSDYGWNGRQMFADVMAGKVQTFPTLYDNYAENLFLTDIPIQKTLRVGQFYTFSIQKKKRNEIVLIHDGEFVHEAEWQREGNRYTIRYMPVAAGPLKLSVAQSGDTYGAAVTYQVAPPTAQELKNVERHYPYKMPEMKRLKNLDVHCLELIGVKGEEVLRQARQGALRALPVLYKDAELFLRGVNIPLSETLQAGQTYTFSFIPQKGRDWQIINGEDWLGTWSVDEETGRWTMQVTPHAGSLKLAVQRDEAGVGGPYSTMIGYTVR
ncbi:MAG: hypothetical protein IJ511_05250 [Bacteroides sp.]|nr:hypothetical protein [Bacteroides sp.]